MKRKIRRTVVPLALASAAAITWVVFPSPFVHGIVLGVVGLLGLIVGGVVVVARRMRKRLGKRLQPPPLPTGSWAYEMEAEDLDGEPLGFSRFSGKVLVLNFWATWCAPCVAEMPGLQRLLDATSDLDVQMACVTREDRTLVQKFVEKRGIGVPVCLLSEEAPACFKSRAIPATFILDKTGMIALRHFGAASWDDDSVVAFVRGLAATPMT